MQAGYLQARLCVRACTLFASSHSYLRSHSLGRAQSFTVKQDQSPNLRCPIHLLDLKGMRNRQTWNVMEMIPLIPGLSMFYPKQTKSQDSTQNVVLFRPTPSHDLMMRELRIVSVAWLLFHNIVSLLSAIVPYSSCHPELT